jgi:hypothetical protein
VEGSRDIREGDLQYMRGCSEALIVSFAIRFPPTNPRSPKQQNLGAPILISKTRHQYLHEGCVNDLKRMNNESYIRITLSNLTAQLAGYGNGKCWNMSSEEIFFSISTNS